MCTNWINVFISQAISHLSQNNVDIACKHFLSLGGRSQVLSYFIDFTDISQNDYFRTIMKMTHRMRILSTLLCFTYPYKGFPVWIWWTSFFRPWYTSRQIYFRTMFSIFLGFLQDLIAPRSGSGSGITMNVYRELSKSKKIQNLIKS